MPEESCSLWRRPLCIPLPHHPGEGLHPPHLLSPPSLSDPTPTRLGSWLLSSFFLSSPHVSIPVNPTLLASTFLSLLHRWQVWWEWKSLLTKGKGFPFSLPLKPPPVQTYVHLTFPEIKDICPHCPPTLQPARLSSTLPHRHMGHSHAQAFQRGSLLFSAQSAQSLLGFSPQKETEATSRDRRKEKYNWVLIKRQLRLTQWFPIEEKKKTQCHVPCPL